MNRETILLVEDNPDEAELAMLGFGQANGTYDIHLAPNGEEALEFLFATGRHSERPPAQKPNLVILDIDLPRVNGFEVLRQLRQSDAYRYTPIVILTTSDEHSDILRGYQLGVNSYLRKPVDFDSFADLLQQVSHYWLKSNSHPSKSTSERERD